MFRLYSSKYLDTQMFDRPGFPDWRDKISEVNARRDKIREKAGKKATELGHILFPWTCMNSAMCRKCGRIVNLHNIHGMTDTGDMSGRAIMQKCDVGFDHTDNFDDYTVQDYNGMTVI